MTPDQWALAAAMLVVAVCLLKLASDLFAPARPVQYVAVQIPPFPRTFGEFVRYPFPLAVDDMWLQGDAPAGVSTVYNEAGALARMNGSKFKALLPPTCPNRTR